MSQKIIYIDSQLRNDADTPQDFNVNLSALQRDQGFAKCDKLKCQLVDIAIDNIWDLQGCYFTLVEGDVGCDVGDITETFINLYTDSADKYTPTFTNYLQLYDFLVILKSVLDAKTAQTDYSYAISVTDEIITITSSVEGGETSSFRFKNMSKQMMALLGTTSTNYPTSRSEAVTYTEKSCLCYDSISVECTFIKPNDVFTSGNVSSQTMCKLYKKNGFRWMEKRISRYYTVNPNAFTNFRVRVFDDEGNLMKSFPEFSFCLKVNQL